MSRGAQALALTALVVLMGRLTVLAARPFNGDSWFHLTIGRGLWSGWSLRHPGRLSSFGDAPWVPTQWSTELASFAFERWFGLAGVACFYGALFLALLVVVYLTCRAHADLLASAVAAGFTIVATGPALSARPQVVSLILLSIVSAAWLRAGRTRRPPYVLVPMTWLWATAHGMWTVGVVVGVVMTLGLALDGGLPRRRLLGMMSVPVGSLVAACLTPVGLRLLSSQRVVAERAPYIGEWGPTSFRASNALVFMAMVAVVLVHWSLRGRRPPLTHLLLLGLACGWALLVTRMVACSAVLIAPLVATSLQEALGSQAVRTALRRSERWVLVGAPVLALGVLAVVAPHTTARPDDVPLGLDARLAALPHGTPVVVGDGVGAWLEWRHPGLDPVIDGMLDAYPLGYMKRAMSFVSVEPGWQRFLAQTHAQVAVVVTDSALCDAMIHELGWRQVERSGTWSYLAAPSTPGARPRSSP